MWLPEGSTAFPVSALRQPAPRLSPVGEGAFAALQKKQYLKMMETAQVWVGFFFFVVIQCLFVVILFNLW